MKRRLIGLARTISDGETVCYVQDLLVRPDAQRGGVGRLLMEDLQRRYRARNFYVDPDGIEILRADTDGQ